MASNNPITEAQLMRAVEDLGFSAPHSLGRATRFQTTGTC